MNGVFALCHFCEQHGPRIVFSTQAFHSIGANPEDFVEERPSDVDGHSLLGEDLSLLDVSHSSLGSAASSFNERTDEAAAGIADGCAACRWPVAVPGFVTYVPTPCRKRQKRLCRNSFLETRLRAPRYISS